MNEIVVCCAKCGVAGGISLKACKSCMSVKYCNAKCRRNHWATHKKLCKQRAAELHDEALFKDPPTNEDCPICFLPMPKETILCASLPPATISSVPIYDFACANKELATKDTETYYSCCGNSICKGCVNSCRESGNDDKCPFCNSDRCITSYEAVEEIRSRAAANDPTSMILLGHHYFHGKGGIQRDQAKAIELYTKAVDLGHGKAHFHLADVYHKGGESKKARFHYEAAAMAGHDNARINLGILEVKSGNIERAIKHWTIAASSGHYNAMFQLKTCFEEGFVSRESINSTLTAYNNSCAEMRSKARDAVIVYILITLVQDEEKAKFIFLRTQP